MQSFVVWVGLSQRPWIKPRAGETLKDLLESDFWSSRGAWLEYRPDCVAGGW